MSIFAQVWLWSLAAFVLGVLLTWILLVRPAQARVRELERKLVESRSEPIATQHGHSDYAEYQEYVGHSEHAGYADDRRYGTQLAHPSEAPPEQHTYQPTPAGFVESTEMERFDEFEPAFDQEPTPERTHEQEHAASEFFGAADEERTEYLPPAEGRTRVDLNPVERPSGIGSALNPDEQEHAEPEDVESEGVEPEPARGLFQPALPSTTTAEYDLFAEQAQSAISPTEPQDAGPASESLPKRQPRDAPLGGFAPPEPVQPSMRTVTRREPAAEDSHTGSLFEPGVPTGQQGGQDLAAEPPAGPDTDSGGPPVGPFGPGSAMPLPGGGKPAEDFEIKASVTTLRYCPQDSTRFAEMVAEVWFRTAEDAERVGFRPIS